MAVALLPTFSFAEIPEYNTDAFQDCTILETNDDHVIYQCPTDIQWIIDVKQNEPNGMFRYNFDDDENIFELVLNDTEHDYIEIAFNDPDFCEEDYTIRTKINQPGEDFWAFVGCK